MTKNEAIEVIKLALAQVEWDYPMDYAVAFDMAIKALEQEPTTKNLAADIEDAVERLNAIKQLIGYDKDSEIVKATQKSLDMAIKALEQEPTTKNDLGVDAVSRQEVLYLVGDYDLSMGQVVKGIHALPSVTPQEPTIKALGEELRKARKGIADKKVLIGYNLAVAICNKHLGEREDKE